MSSSLIGSLLPIAVSFFSMAGGVVAGAGLDLVPDVRVVAADAPHSTWNWFDCVVLALSILRTPLATLAPLLNPPVFLTSHDDGGL
jgi:hypothetical protein